MRKVLIGESGKSGTSVLKLRLYQGPLPVYPALLDFGPGAGWRIAVLVGAW